MPTTKSAEVNAVPTWRGVPNIVWAELLDGYVCEVSVNV